MTVREMSKLHSDDPESQMSDFNALEMAPSREQLIHSLYEAAELEHCLM